MATKTTTPPPPFPTHTQGIIHRDIKPQNCLLGSREDRRLSLYLVDYGLARDGFKEENLGKKLAEGVSFRGTAAYAAGRAHLIALIVGSGGLAAGNVLEAAFRGLGQTRVARAVHPFGPFVHSLVHSLVHWSIHSSTHRHGL